jgi:hypothetical protein
MKVGDLVRTDDTSGPIGIVVELTKRLYIPAAKILVEGEVMEFDVEELWRFYESR